MQAKAGRNKALTRALRRCCNRRATPWGVARAASGQQVVVNTEIPGIADFPGACIAFLGEGETAKGISGRLRLMPSRSV
jgi:hypothetical protein